MQSTLSPSPLARLLEDDDLLLMEQLLPFCRPPVAKFLAVQMKVMEIQKIIAGFDDEPYLHACGFDDSSADLETVLRSLRPSLSEEKTRQIDSILQVIQFSRLYQTWQETMHNHPELVEFLSQNFGQRSGEKGPASEAFSDPSVFLMLNSLLGNDEKNGEKMREILSAFFKK